MSNKRKKIIDYIDCCEELVGKYVLYHHYKYLYGSFNQVTKIISAKKTHIEIQIIGLGLRHFSTQNGEEINKEERIPAIASQCKLITEEEALIKIKAWNYKTYDREIKYIYNNDYTP